MWITRCCIERLVAISANSQPALVLFSTVGWKVGDNCLQLARNEDFTCKRCKLTNKLANTYAVTWFQWVVHCINTEFCLLALLAHRVTISTCGRHEPDLDKELAVACAPLPSYRSSFPRVAAALTLVCATSRLIWVSSNFVHSILSIELISAFCKSGSIGKLHWEGKI